MLLFAFKKMLRNKWMVSCLLIGAMVFVAVLSIIPTYSNGVYRHMLIRDLEAQQVRRGEFPGNWFLNIMIRGDDDERSNNFSSAHDFEQLVEERYVPGMGLPVLASRKQYTLDRFFYHTRARGETLQVSIYGIENFWDHVDIISGRVPENDLSNDVMEFVISRADYQRSDIRLNQEFDIFTYALPADTDRLYGRAVCVGIFEQRFDEPFWYTDIGIGQLNFILDFDFLVERYVIPETIFVSAISFFYSFDYTELRLENVDSIMRTTARVRSDIYSRGVLSFPTEFTLRSYMQRRDVLEFMLWILIIPVITMLVFYIYMVSKLMINYESNEIAVLKSRGARNRQIFSVYAVISLLIAGFAFITGPPLGLLAGRVLGFSNGFMELVARRGLPLELSRLSFLYAGFAALMFVFIMLIPALRATRDTIVKSKQKKSRRVSAPLWQRLFLDLVLIAVSIYALYLYSANAAIRALADVSGTGAPVDPLVLAASSMFVLGAGLGFLRIYPFLIKLIYRLGKNNWPPTLYTTLLSISRFKGSGQFLALFLVFNIGLGLFNATAARTLNRFLEDRVRYENGADIVLTQTWPVEFFHYRVEVSDSGEVSYHRLSPVQLAGGAGSGGFDEMIISRTQVREPPFDVFPKLAGVENATKVFKRDTVRISAGGQSISATIMGIIPHEFGEIAWFRNDLSSTHINNYLNLMTNDPSAVFLSSSMRDEYGFMIGDRVRIGWADQSSSLDCTVYGFVDFWPSINPVAKPNFIVANLDTLQRQMRIEPYSIWLSLFDSVSSYEFYETLNDTDIRVGRISDTRQDLISIKNDPMLQGMNGTLTLGFIVTLCITFIGFLIYWVLSIKSRLLQFGILRAMGLSRFGLVLTLMWEQLFVSGSAIAAGFGIGILASRLFVPTLQLIYSASEQIPPFLTTANRADYITLLLAFGGMLITGLIILIVMIRRLKTDQVLKLGED